MDGFPRSIFNIFNFRSTLISISSFSVLEDQLVGQSPIEKVEDGAVAS